MADSLKQRLIGAVLLLSVVIVIAVFLVNSANDGIQEPVQTIQADLLSSVTTEQEKIAAVEPEVLLDPHKLETPPDVKKPDSLKPAVVAPQVKEEKTVKPESRTSAVKKPIDKKAEGPVQQWLIQLASFSKQENAKALQEKVSKLGLQAHIEQVSHNGATNYRVRIGPESERQNVDKIVKTIRQSLALKPQVLTVKAN